ncbi:MAG TPA: inorganic phosphate transporter [Deltaproteobacteria bacterium]|nr:inorganic phosphate transporter [Deltaproteobacteria bacterium]
MELIFTPVILFSLLVGFYMAWNIGANDLANSMGTSVGSRALSIKQAILVAAILEFGGAVFVGSHVTDTVRKKIVDVRVLSLHIGPEAFICGMLAAILGAAIWITIATYFSLPVSTTHSIVGAVVGFGIVAAGIDTINFGKLAEIVASWIISPIAGGILSFLTFTIIKREVFDKDDKMECAKRVVPYFVGFVSTVLVLSMVYKGPEEPPPRHGHRRGVLHGLGDRGDEWRGDAPLFEKLQNQGRGRISAGGELLQAFTDPHGLLRRLRPWGQRCRQRRRSPGGDRLCGPNG